MKPLPIIAGPRPAPRRAFSSPLDVLNPEVLEIFRKLCIGKSPDDHVFVNADTGKAFHDIKRSFHTACRLVGIDCLWWHDLRATLFTRLALARYEALTIMSLIGHSDLKTMMRYIRAVQLQREVRPEQFVDIGHTRRTAANVGRP